MDDEEMNHTWPPLSDYAEPVFSLMLEDGLKSDHHETTTARVTNMNVLPEALRLEDHLDVDVLVDVKLARDKDRDLPHRAQLADSVQLILDQELRDSFATNSMQNITPFDKMLRAPLLWARVVLVSDGCSSGRRFASGVGKPKLTVQYCLLNSCPSESNHNETSHGQVALANQVYATEEPKEVDTENYMEYSAAEVRCMARSVAQKIADEVKTAVGEWKSAVAEGEQLSKISVKLANEEDLEPEEYRLATKHHLLDLACH